jgi:hypothetical protein
LDGLNRGWYEKERKKEYNGKGKRRKRKDGGPQARIL